MNDVKRFPHLVDVEAIWAQPTYYLQYKACVHDKNVPINAYMDLVVGPVNNERMNERTNDVDAVPLQFAFIYDVCCSANDSIETRPHVVLCEMYWIVSRGKMKSS